MPRSKRTTNDEIAALIQQGLTSSEIQRQTGSSNNTYFCKRINRIAAERNLIIQRSKFASAHTVEEQKAEQKLNEYIASKGRRHLKVNDGIILICSDEHYLPDVATTAHRAFVKFCRNMRPRAVISNGDAFDGAAVGRWPRIGWQHRPTVLDELKAVEVRKTEIEEAAGTRELYWNLGNHDARFETRLAAHAPEYQGVRGFQLKEHFPLWLPSWAIWINEDVVVKHRFKGGIHAPHNNTLWAGKTVITGHLHSAKITPLSDYNGTRYGVDAGTLALPYGDQFVDYTEDNPVNWRSAFVVLTFWKGTLLMPELCTVLDEEAGLVQFRGTVLKC